MGGMQPSHSRLLVLCKFDGVRQDSFGGWDGCTISPCGPPPGVLTLILLHVSPISTNGAAIVPPLCAVVPSAQSPWVSKLSPVMFGLLPTHTGIHDDDGHPSTHTHTLLVPIHWHNGSHKSHDITIYKTYNSVLLVWGKKTYWTFVLCSERKLNQNWIQLQIKLIETFLLLLLYSFAKKSQISGPL